MKIIRSLQTIISILIFTTFQIKAQNILFYEGSTGSAEMYEIAQNGGLGKLVKKINNGWKKTWTDVEYYYAKGKDMMLFYEGSTGSAEMYEIAQNGKLGKLVKKINNGWRKTWTDVQYYRAKGKDMMLFYEGSTGSAEMYEIAQNGKLGKLVKKINNGWRKTWTDVEYYRTTGKDMMLFYEGSTGSAEIYEIAQNGELGKLVKKINNGWRKTWTDVEYYRAKGEDMMLFYEGSTGSAEMYEITNNGDLGNLVKKINNGWRKTWTAITFNYGFIRSSNSDPGTICTELGESRINQVRIKNLKQRVPRSGQALTISTNSLWPIGKSITVSMDNTVSQNLKTKIINLANEWSNYANISFKLLPSNGDIHVKFDSNAGHYSLIGNQSKDWFIRTGYDIISRGTMNLAVNENTSESYLRHKVLHEFGHALGFHHEHQNPSINIQWDKEKVYEYYKNTEGWDRGEVDHNLFKKLDKGQTQYSVFDPNSIMAYYVPNSLTIGNFFIPGNTQLSEMDKSFAQIAYPFPNSSGNKIRVTITTGSDDLREKSNANLIINYKENSAINEFQVSLNRGRKWDNHSTNSKDIPLPNGVGINDVLSITLFFGSGKRDFPYIDEDDSWKINNLKLEYVDANGNAFTMIEELNGNPYIYFVGKRNPYLEISF
ncbi:M12 family metallopeptidase [Aquimarina megaterium]|uniref:M12 family metallopeptidase n=1 Tax=Aquimarina megaterium TaxID=1443666 RepID=UPI000944FD1B|nr:M12 family metallopeptidase [Aquimarina megaterium]